MKKAESCNPSRRPGPCLPFPSPVSPQHRRTHGASPTRATRARRQRSRTGSATRNPGRCPIHTRNRLPHRSLPTAGGSAVPAAERPAAFPRRASSARPAARRRWRRGLRRGPHSRHGGRWEAKRARAPPAGSPPSEPGRGRHGGSRPPPGPAGTRHLLTRMIWSRMGRMSWKLCWLTRL